MKVVVDTKKLIGLISSVSVNQGKKSGLLPAHEYVILQAKGNKFKATKRSESCQISQFFTLEEEVKEDFVGCINCNTLLNVIKTLKVATTSFEVKTRKNGSSYMFIKYGRGSSKIECIKPSEFDFMIFQEAKYKATVVGDELFKKIKNSSICVDENDVRIQFTAVSVEINENGGNVRAFTPICGTTQKIGVAEGSLDHVFVPRSICNLLNPAIMTGSTSISTNDKMIKMNNGSFEMIGVLIDAKPLPVQQIYDQKSSDNFVVDRSMLIESVGRILNFTGIDDNMIVMSFIGNDLVIESDNDLMGKSGQEVVPILSKSGDDLTIGIDGMFLHSCLRTIESNNVRIHGGDPKKPMFVSEESGYTEDWCLSPIMVEGGLEKRREKNEEYLRKLASKGGR